MFIGLRALWRTRREEALVLPVVQASVVCQPGPSNAQIHSEIWPHHFNMIKVIPKWRVKGLGAVDPPANSLTFWGLVENALISKKLKPKVPTQ